MSQKSSLVTTTVLTSRRRTAAILTGFVPASGDADLVQTVTIQGSNFEPTMTVNFGSETPIPTNVTPTSADVVVGPQTAGVKTVTVTRLGSPA